MKRAALVALVLLTAGCGEAGSASTTSTTSRTSAASTTAPTGPMGSTSVTAAPTTSPAGGELGTPTVTVSGTITEGVRSTCLILKPTDGNGQWLLLGKNAGLRAGQSVVVRGQANLPIASYCMQGRPLVVTEVLSATPTA